MRGVSLKNVPVAVWICVVIAFVATLAAFVTLSVTGSDATEFRSFLNTVLNFATLLVSGGAAVYAGAAATNAQKANEQTNGQLDGRIQTAIEQALQTHTDNNGNGVNNDGRSAF